MERVSLVIGTYNPSPSWLQEALESAKGLFDEIIIVDDGSDNAVEGATVRHAKNLGFWQARNTGIQVAKGEIIAFLDDDDTFIRENVLKLKEFIEKNDSDIWHFPISQFGEYSGLWGQNYNFRELLNYNQIPSGSWFRKKVWEKLGGFEEPICEDWDFWIRAYLNKFKFTYFPEPVYNHRMRVGSLSWDWTGTRFLGVREKFRKKATDFLENAQTKNSLS